MTERTITVELPVWICEQGHHDDTHLTVANPERRCSRCGGRCYSFKSLDELAGALITARSAALSSDHQGGPPAEECPCGKPDPGIKPGGGCRCSDESDAAEQPPAPRGSPPPSRGPESRGATVADDRQAREEKVIDAVRGALPDLEQGEQIVISALDPALFDGALFRVSKRKQPAAFVCRRGGGGDRG